MIPCSFFKDETFEEINSDFSKITSIGAEAFKNCVNLKHLVFPSVHSIGLDAFNNCPNLTLSFPVSSLINLDCDNKSYAVCSEIFLRTFNVKKLTICGREIPLDETGYRTFSKLQGEEIEGVVSYVLYSLNLKYDYPYFKYDIVEVMQHCDIDLIKKPIYDYIVNHKAFTFMTKKKLKEFINEKIKEYYDVNHTCKDVYNELVKVNNPLFTLEPNEVLQKIPNEKTADIDINIPTTIMDYGSNFDNYFGYIANAFSAVLNKENIKKEDAINLINLFDKYSLVCDSRINNDVLNELLGYLSNTEKNAYDRIIDLEECKKLMDLYIAKIYETQNILRHNLENPFVLSKIDSLSQLLLSINMQRESINSIMENEFNFYGVVSNINKTLFPNLLVTMRNKNTDIVNKSFEIIIETLKAINDEEKEKQKKKLSR